jgi:hypothetical protein
MNLHNIVAPCIAVINPMLTASIQVSTGYTTGSDGLTTPAYAPAVNVQVQMQSLTYNDLYQLDGMDINGEKHAMYINGNWEGVVRPDGKGGDIITMPNGDVYLVAQILENWADTDGWTKVAVTRQMNP